MAKKDKDTNGTDEKRNALYITQLKLVAMNSRVDGAKQRQNAISTELSLIASKLPEMEAARDKLIEEYKPAYDELKTLMEVPEGHELNLETGEAVKSQQ